MTTTLQESCIASLPCDTTFIQASPDFNAVMLPSSSTEAICVSEELHFTDLLSASSGVTVAVSCSASPTFSVRLCCDKAIPVTGCMTTTLQESCIASLPCDTTFIQASPDFNAVTLPSSSTEATCTSEELHFTDLLSASSGVTVAVSCSASPTFSVRLCCDKDISITGCMTITLQESCAASLSCDTTFIQTSPDFNAITLPSSSTEAISPLEELQVTDLLSASSGVTIAVSCSVSPTFSIRLCCNKDIPFTGCMTTTLQESRTKPSIDIAMILASPGEIAEISPVSLVVAICVLSLYHRMVISSALSGITDAANCNVSFTFMMTSCLSIIICSNGCASSIMTN